MRWFGSGGSASPQGVGHVLQILIRGGGVVTPTGSLHRALLFCVAHDSGLAYGEGSGGVQRRQCDSGGVLC